MVLAHRDQALAPLVEHEVSVPDVLLRRDRDWRESGILTVEPLICEVREPDRALLDQVGAASILMDAGPSVEPCRSYVVDDSPGAPADDNVATRLGGTLLDPVDVIAIELNLGEADDARDDRVGGDRRAPAAVRTGAHVTGHVLQATRCIPSLICGVGAVLHSTDVAPA